MRLNAAVRWHVKDDASGRPGSPGICFARWLERRLCGRRRWRGDGRRCRQNLVGLHGCRTPARSKCFFTCVSSAKRTVHCFSSRVVKVTRRVNAVLLRPTSPANDGSPITSPRISSIHHVGNRVFQRLAGFIQIFLSVDIVVGNH